MNTEFDRNIRPDGENFVWLTASGLAFGLLMVVVLLGIIFYNGITVFWPREIVEVKLAQGSKGPKEHSSFSGWVVEERSKRVSDASGRFDRELKFFVGNKDVYGEMFLFVNQQNIVSTTKPANAVLLERVDNGQAIVYPASIKVHSGTVAADSQDFYSVFQEQVNKARGRYMHFQSIARGPLGELSRKLKENEIAREVLLAKNPNVAAELQRMIKLAESADASSDKSKLSFSRSPEMDAEYQSLQSKGKPHAKMDRLLSQRLGINSQTEVYLAQTQSLLNANKETELTYRLSTGEEKTLAIGEILQFSRPNQMGFFDKIIYFISHLWEFLSAQPRSSNTEGGVFPAIFGTFVMTVLMSAAVVPFGVLAAIYLREYAKQGQFVTAIRIAINNLAGVPSIVYGVFGLGFFVYTMGGTIDDLFFADRQLINQPTFKTGGILWSALTLALMTVPVVVVATEEALAAVPRGMREASLACGASKWQTIQRVVMPASLSGILTGLILAMARGAGEVAPLMVVGVIKLAPDLPLDASFPFIHLDRKFMHLGFHIYDLGFQSPDSEAARPMVFAATFLLISLVVILNLSAILIRDHLRRKYSTENF